MATIVGIQFQKNGKIYNYDVNNLDIHQDEYVIADTSHGIDLGQVVIGCRQLSEEESNGLQLKKIIRTATEADLQTSAENRKKEREAYEICQKKIAEHKLDMKLVSVEYAFDNSKALFYFTANGRVDFRSLVKDLASVFKMRIELRQIGVRDEARMLGGLGPCGRQICCGSFLEEFQPVSIKMAKEQNLSLNPTKISGVCGRLMCCLKYEQDHYEQARKIMPRIGKEVITPDGAGIVSDLNILKETVFVRISNGDSSEIKEYSLDKIERTAVSGNNAGTKREGTKNKEETDQDLQDLNVSELPASSEENESEERSREARRKPSHHNGNPKQKESKKVSKPENNQKNRALGKPVMRENPNKTAQKPSARQSEDTSAKDHQSSQQPAASANWAEAVRKAIDSIN